MLRIKLQRVGKKNDPSFRVVVTDKRTGPKSNKHVAQVGHYDAIRKTVVLNKEEINEWITKGAQPTDTVHNILVKEKVIEGKKRNVLSKKTPIIAKKKEEKPEKKEEELKEESPGKPKIKEVEDEKEEVQEETEQEKEETEEETKVEEIKEEPQEEKEEKEEK